MADNQPAALTDFFNLASTANEALVSFTGTTGIAGFIFDIKDAEEVNLESDITDHYTESGNPVQDNIVNKPTRVTLRGTVGEHVYNPPKDTTAWEDIKGTVQKGVEKLVTIGSYLPEISKFSQQAYNSLSADKLSMDSLINVGEAAFDLYNSVNVPKDNQSHAFMFFEALWKAKQTFAIQTPYRNYANMAIESIKAVQSGETNDNTDFEITFKEIRKVIVKSGDDKSLYGRLKEQAGKFYDNYLSDFVESAKDALTPVDPKKAQEIVDRWNSKDY